MPLTQRHFLYLLPRADPDELKAVIAAREEEPLKGLKVLNSLPLQLQVRIPPRPSPSSTSASPSSSTTGLLASRADAQDTGQAQCLPTGSNSSPLKHTSSSTSTSSRQFPVCGEGSRPASGQMTRRTSASVLEKRSCTGTNSIETLPTEATPNPNLGLGYPLSSASSSTPASSTSPSSSSSSQYSSSNLRNSKHHFVSWKLVAPQVKTLSTSSNTYLLCEEFGQTELMPEGASYNLSSKASQAMNTIDEKSSISGLENAEAKSESSNHSGPYITPQCTNNDASSTPPPPTRALPPVPPPPMMQRSLSMSTFSDGSTLAGTPRNGRKWTPLAYRREMESVLFAQSSTSGTISSSLSSPSNPLHAKQQDSRTSYTFPSPSTSSSTSAVRRAASASNHSGYSSCFGSAERDRKFPSGTLSTSSQHSPSSMPQNTLKTSIPFFIDAPILYDENSYAKYTSEADPLYMGRDKVNVCHVSDLDWYLEKLLWKLGMHRKGRKEFLSYWLARFSNAEYIILRFLTQDEINALAPVDITISNPPSALVSVTASHPISASAPDLASRRRHSAASTASSEQSDYNIDSPQQSLPDSLRSSSWSPQSSSASSVTTSPDEQVAIEPAYTVHGIHILFQQIRKDEVKHFDYQVKHRSGSSTLDCIDWTEVDGVSPTEDSKREDRPRLLHVGATDLGERGHYFS